MTRHRYVSDQWVPAGACHRAGEARPVGGDDVERSHHRVVDAHPFMDAHRVMDLRDLLRDGGFRPGVEQARERCSDKVGVDALLVEVHLPGEL